jgi:hypothetical protein
MCFDLAPATDYHPESRKRGIVRQFVYGIVLGAAAMYCYARVDPPKVFDYLNSATQSAVQSTHGYTDGHHKQ